MADPTTTAAVRADLDIGWVAGVVDARGHITIRYEQGKNPAPNIRITTRKYELLDALAEQTGVTVNKDHRPYDRRPCGEHCGHKHQHFVRQSSFWQVNGGRATIVLFNIRPHVRGQKALVRDALLAGLAAFDPKRNGTADAMRALGWEIPLAESRLGV